jgi:hypothetical protein
MLNANFTGDSIRHSRARWSPTCRTGECGTPSAVGHFQERRETSEAASMRPTILDWTQDDLEGLKIRSGDRATGNGNFMAAQTIQTILVEVVTVERTRAPANELGDSQARTMAAANPLWGAPQIHGELLKLGFEISERTVSRLMPKQRKKPSQTWKTFLLTTSVSVLHRLLHCSHSAVESVVCLRSAGA